MNTMQNAPTISVIMSVYNTDEKYLRESINSILNQTFTDYEFIIIDDGSDENTYKELQSYDDKRIRLYRNDTNIGLTKSLNKALRLARGEYIARMDADDVSNPDRLMVQYTYMNTHPAIHILGSNVECERRYTKYYNMPLRVRRVMAVLDNPGPPHPTVMIRRSFLDKHGIRYDENYTKSQDYELWMHSMDYTDIRVLPDTLLYYRIHGGQTSVASNDEQAEYANRLRIQAIRKTGIEASDDELECFVRSRLKGPMKYKEFVRIAKQIVASNYITHAYDSKWLKYVMSVFILKHIKWNLAGMKTIGALFAFLLSGRLLYYIYGELMLIIYRYTERCV